MGLFSGSKKSTSVSTISTTTDTTTANANAQDTQGLALTGITGNVSLTDPGALALAESAVKLAAEVSLGAMASNDQFSRSQSEAAYQFAREAATPDRGLTEKVVLYIAIAAGVVGVALVYRKR